LPNRYYFSTDTPSTSILVIPKKFARNSKNRGGGNEGQAIKKGGIDKGGGFEGKHFIERAWLENYERIRGRWQKDVVAATKVWGK
jgi:hypothetical protein